MFKVSTTLLGFDTAGPIVTLEYIVLEEVESVWTVIKVDCVTISDDKLAHIVSSIDYRKKCERSVMRHANTS